jgi:hypothetical protein
LLAVGIRRDLLIGNSLLTFFHQTPSYEKA